MTFSIVAHDPDAPDGAEWGVAVASKFLAAGSVVPWAMAGAGAIATQALANITYGPRGLDLLAAGDSAVEVVASLTESDEGRNHRQIGTVDAKGSAATYTGSECLTWAGGVVGPGFACQGNILTGPEVIDEMASTYRRAPGNLASRLVASLLAGDRAGGDSRGRQAAGLFVVREGGGYLGGTDVAVDLRVDDHADPVPELARLLAIHSRLFPRPSELVFLPLETHADEARQLLATLGYTGELETALSSFVGTENLEARWREDATIEQGVLDALREAAAGRVT